MFTRLLIPAALALIILGAADPADARRRHRGGGDRQRVANRAEHLYRSGRLSRDHYNRTMDKLNHRGGRNWTGQVDNTLGKWSRSDSGRGRGRRRR